MTKIKCLKQSEITRKRNSPNKSGLVFKEFGKYNDLDKYSDTEITEMTYGIYKDKKVIIVDGDYAVDLKEITEIVCELKKVTYYKNPSFEELKQNKHNEIKNIRTFYIKGYYLVSENEIYGNKRHDITKILFKLGAYRNGKNNFRELYGIRNDFKAKQEFKQGKFPKDLYDPIKVYINGLIYQDDYKFSNFKVETSIDIIS